MSFSIERITGDESVFSKALIDLKKKPHINYDQSSKLNSVANRTEPFAILAKNLSTTGSISSKKNIMLLNCPQLGDVTSGGHVMLIGCKDHGKITANGHIFALNSDFKHLNPGPGYTLYIVSPSKSREVSFMDGEKETETVESSESKKSEQPRPPSPKSSEELNEIVNQVFKIVISDAE